LVCLAYEGQEVANNHDATSPCDSSGSKCNSTGIQTRYSFYEAEDYNATNEIEGSESECTSVEDESPQDSLKAENSSRESMDKMSCMKSDSYISGSPDDLVVSSSAEDILRNLVETEQLGYKTSNIDDADSTDDTRGASLSSVHATTRGLPSRHLSDLTLLDRKVMSMNIEDDDFENSVSTGGHPVPTLSLDTKPARIVGKKNMALYTDSQIPPEIGTKDHLESIMKEALQLVRMRGNKRAAVLKIGSSNTEEGDTSFLTTGLMAPGESSTKDDEWEVYCAQMASYVATLPNSQAESNVSTDPITEIVSTNGLGSNSALPLPRHPPGVLSQNLIPATKLDNRLLSPTVDVRKTVEGASDMFRLKCASCGTEKHSTDTLNTLGTSYHGGLALANPVYSQTTPARAKGNASPVHTSEKPPLRVDTIPPPIFTVVPSSPAPGKFHLLNERNNDTSANFADESMLSNSSALQSDARRASLELERRWRREEEIERGVEKVLITILERANKAPSALEAKEADTGNNWIDQALSSFFATQSSAYSQSGVPHMRRTRVPSQDDGDEDVAAGVEKPTDPATNEKDLKAEDEEENFTIEGSQNAVFDHDETTIHSSSINDECTDSECSTAYVPTDSHQPSRPAPLPHLSESEAHSESAKQTVACVQPYISSQDEADKVEAVDREAHILLCEPEVEIYDNVLGPLSQEVGGTTGIVLQCDEEQDVDIFAIENTQTSSSAHEELNVPITGPCVSLSPSVVESIISAVQIEPSDSSAVLSNGEVNHESSQRSERREIDEISEGDDHAEEKTSHILVKDLYAHLLPSVGGDTGRVTGTLGGWLTQKMGGKSEHVGELQAWNDHDPNEPGYVSYTLTSAQLKNVEQEYESIISSMKEEHQVLSEVERDIAAAEMILNETDMKRATSIASMSENKTARRNSKSDSRTHTPVRRRRSKVINPLSTNPAFPAAKAAGTGAEGELEIYHLPIIYKAHQTGFEPTKDLVLQPDTVFAGKYYVQNELGSAAFSTAYRCVDLNSGKEGDDKEMYYDEVCLKVIKNTKDFFDQSLDEIKILELLRQTDQCNEHNILEMKTFFYHKEHLIIVTELLRQNLFEFGKYIMENDEPRYFTRQRLCYIARQCLVALSFVHKLGLVHSDIKPENILLASYSKAKVKVIDFGSSCYLSDRQSSYIQSRSYRAPEVVLGLPYDGKIDVWSLGCVIAEMYTGQVTFQNDSVTSMLSRIEAICGTFPKHMIENGRQSGQFFTPSGLLYEKDFADDDSDNRMAQSGVDGEDDSSHNQDTTFTVYQPKLTTMAARLGFDSNIMDRKRRNWEGEDNQNDERALFVDFVKKLLTVDPDIRPSAAAALEHPWILSGFNVSEEDLKYPPEG